MRILTVHVDRYTITIFQFSDNFYKEWKAC